MKRFAGETSWSSFDPMSLKNLAIWPKAITSTEVALMSSALSANYTVVLMKENEDFFFY